MKSGGASQAVKDSLAFANAWFSIPAAGTLRSPASQRGTFPATLRILGRACIRCDSGFHSFATLSPPCQRGHSRACACLAPRANFLAEGPLEAFEHLDRWNPQRKFGVLRHFLCKETVWSSLHMKEIIAGLDVVRLDPRSVHVSFPLTPMQQHHGSSMCARCLECYVECCRCRH
jgi:hypothetical protein